MNTPEKNSPGLNRPTRNQVVAAFGLVYIAWGATYFGIRVAIETIPPLLMAGVRFALAGVIILACVRLFASTQFHFGKWREWRDASIVGLLLIPGGNGSVTWAERSIPSGVAALMVALVPMWLLLLDWLRPGGVPPRKRAIFGLIVGLGGVMLLMKGSHLGEISLQNRWSYGILLCGGICWASGALYSRYVTSKGTPFLAIGRQMLVGGVILILMAWGRGEMATFHPEEISQRSVWAFLYLLVFGSILGFSAYVWLMKVSTPALVGTTAYVNPAIAVYLGVVWGGEVLTRDQIAGGICVLIAVMILTLSKK